MRFYGPAALLLAMKKTEQKRSEAKTTESKARELGEDKKPDLSDAEMQEQYRLAYLAQLRRLQCPGCGEDELF